MLSTFSESARGAVLDVTRPPVLHSRRLGTGRACRRARRASDVGVGDRRGDLQALTTSVCEIARAAGAEIMRHYEGAVRVRRKHDDSPVTDADEAAERLILSGLREIAPATPVVAEEQTSRGGAAAIGEGRFWLVDPLDGTREFISRNGEFTVNVALVESGRPILGVVYLPARRLLYCAYAPGAAFVQGDGAAPKPIACRPVPQAGLVVVASRSHRDERTEAYINGLDVARFTAAGSSLKFCRVASGEADLYPRFGRTMEWDTAAGHAVLAAAGGSVKTLDGAELAYGKPGYENPEFIARGRDS